MQKVIIHYESIDYSRAIYVKDELSSHEIFNMARDLTILPTKVEIQSGYGKLTRVLTEEEQNHE